MNSRQTYRGEPFGVSRIESPLTWDCEIQNKLDDYARVIYYFV